MTAIGLRLTRYVPSAIDKQLRYSFYSLLAILVTMAFLFPLYWGLSTSLRTPLETFTIAGFGIPWVSFTPTLNNWIDQLQVPETQHALVNSSLIASLATLLALLVGTPAAYALARFRFELVQNRDITIFFFSERVLPPVATVIPFYLVMRSLGLLDTRPADRARGIGADRRRRSLGRVLAHRAAAGGPAIAATALIIFGRAWNEFLFALAIAAKGAITIPVHMAGTAGTRGVQFWYLAVRQMIAIVPPVLIALLAQRYIVRGLTLGAVKG